MTETREVPTVMLPGGVAMPMVGFGTWPMRGPKASEATLVALDAGYRHIDTATMYANEAEVGQALRDSGLPREDVFLTTKLRASDAGREREVLTASLRALGTDYVAAARALGASPTRVLRRHVLPNAIGPAVVAVAFGVASVVLTEAAVDFLRVGPPSTMASWGEALGEARTHAGAWWLVAFPGVSLLATLVALNLVGEAARDALDPRVVLRGATARQNENT